MTAKGGRIQSDSDTGPVDYCPKGLQVLEGHGGFQLLRREASGTWLQDPPCAPHQETSTFVPCGATRLSFDLGT